jgi:hypothetical protein
MLPFFFRHYDPLVERYVIYDNGSTDGSLALLKENRKVSLRHFEVTGDSFVEEERRLSDVIWEESRGSADWVIVLDIDEHLFHPDLAGYLRQCSESGITALRGIGYEMVADHFPTPERALVESVTLGARSAGHDKLCIFNPDAVTHTHFRPGRHVAFPEGRITWPEQPEMLLLHYKQLGVEYAIQRSAELRQGLREGDLAQHWGVQYSWSPAEIAARWARLRAEAAPVPGLGSLEHIAPAFYDEEHVVAKSGLMDTQWYLTTYPDIAAADANALSHFCIHGWKERRKPNFYFDPGWYLENNPNVRADGQNPLIHYIVSGESNGAWPSPYFDPSWYRQCHGLEASLSPLQQYLSQRHTGLVSPLSTFDVDDYVRAFPEREPGFQDPFEESLWRNNQPPPRPQLRGELPLFRDIVSMLGSDPRDRSGTTTVHARLLLDILKSFLQVVAVDEARYCQAYPDVAAAIAAGNIASARTHFIECGYFEGRSPVPQ